MACGEDLKKAQPQRCSGQRQGSASIYTPVVQSLIVDCLCSSSPRVGKESIGSSVRTAFSQRPRYWLLGMKAFRNPWRGKQ